MTNAFTSLIRAAVGAKGQRTCLNADMSQFSHREMLALSMSDLKEIRGGDGVIESPKGSWNTPVSGSTSS